MTRVGPIVPGILAGLVACIACAVLVAVSIAIVDLYLAGHGLPTLGRPWVDHGAFRFSRGDALMNACGLLVGVGTGIVVARGVARTRRTAA